ncbi:hypothetical protein HER10_EVM0003401 [Colletotrichum scovillei]|uniref:Ankyrin and het domain-containing protein n=1 Tax=Colletotrichum scovillei TaxID=1209932 RepID=A0A9P7RAK2_9PEZI|nr:uncharacterized protein HER10_EVM0003401 [Colletotrichum scovillei]KAF4782830.1 hypothetical protein HER10_EVM0003401 [Colletotrichum scovillei]KAG7053022.1 ankyrin and het domain-containing protein [Colletotrichum scovillei]KAG7071316.1 ankyrin and het domain-containing protein [Colletotrichum scovillei]KAG7079534.1 ankyrin and het domain-containing protein [Colletotrichum scovillei]
MTEHQMTSSLRPFQYQSLDPEKKEVRLIEIAPLETEDPGSPADLPVRCRLKHASLNEGQSYVAVSYAWGDADITKDILVDDQWVQVTTNLEAALRQLASRRVGEDLGSTFWIDALCIDQQNEAERAQQVSCMREIYRYATKTFIWLGLASLDSDLAMDTLFELNKLVDSGAFAVMLSWSEFPFAEIAVNLTVDRVQTMLRGIIGELCHNKSARLNAIGSLFERAWFQRVWVIQERVLSKDCVVCCGDTCTSWDAFYDGFWVLCGVRDYLNIVGSGTGRRDSSKLVAFLTAALDRVTPVAFTRPNSSLFTLFSLLSRMANKAQLQASDQRDYVFSLFGLISPDLSPYIPVQYNKDWQTVRTEVAKACLIYYGPKILSFAGLGGVHSYAAGMVYSSEPSWAPDWSSKFLAQPLHVPSIFMVRGQNRERAYTASGSLSQSLSAAFSDENRFIASSLSLKAVKVGTIAKRGEHFVRLKELNGEADGLQRSLFLRWLDDMESTLAGTNAVYKTDEALREALWRTPIADREFAFNWETERASGEMFMSYQALRQGMHYEGMKYMNVALAKLIGRCPFVTDGGYVGLAPMAAKVGDDVWIIIGADAPFITSTRSFTRTRYSRIVGEAYVHGIMDGELLQGTIELQTLKLT